MRKRLQVEEGEETVEMQRWGLKEEMREIGGLGGGGRAGWDWKGPQSLSWMGRWEPHEHVWCKTCSEFVREHSRDSSHPCEIALRQHDPGVTLTQRSQRVISSMSAIASRWWTWSVPGLCKILSFAVCVLYRKYNNGETVGFTSTMQQLILPADLQKLIIV